MFGFMVHRPLLFPLSPWSVHECEVNIPEVFTACAVTRAMAHADAAVHVRDSKGARHDTSELVAFSMSDVPLLVSLEDLKTEQRADPSLAALFEQVLPPEDVSESSRGYVVDNDILLRNGFPTVTILLPTWSSSLWCNLSFGMLC